MDTNLHTACRAARAIYIQRTLALRDTTVYVDAARYTKILAQGNYNMLATLIGSDLREITSSPVNDCTVVEAKEAAVALAAAEGYRSKQFLTIISDSQAAYRNNMNGRISRCPLRILRSCGAPQKDKQGRPLLHMIVWTPGHEGVVGNQEADRVAREHTKSRASRVGGPEVFVPIPQRYTAILDYFKGVRRRYPHHTNYLVGKRL